MKSGVRILRFGGQDHTNFGADLSKTPAKPTQTAADQAGVSSDDEVASFLAEVRARVPRKTAPGRRGRVIFAMDATASREPTWDRAQAIQADMFNETARLGGLSVQLVYFRGYKECRASKWVDQPEKLRDLMTSVSCRGGHTQIGTVLTHIKRENSKDRVDAVIYVGDCFEEDIDEVCARAGEVGISGVPIFVFQEGFNSVASRAFAEIARLTRGAHCRFNAGSADQLRDLLRAVAVFAAGGRKALADHAVTNRQGRALLEYLS